MASKVLVPTAPFAKLQIKSKSPPSEPGFVVSGDPASRAAHLEHSVRFLQEQHRLMLGGLHSEIEALRERNRDLQFQLIFNKESSSKTPSPSTEDTEKNEEPRLKQEISRLEREAAAARGAARAAEARALQLQTLVDAQAEKIRELTAAASHNPPEGGDESRAELRARLADAERLVRRLRGDAERQRRELQCMKNSLQASIRASGLEAGFGFHNSYHFPPLQSSDFWREPLREDYNLMGSRNRNNRRPITLPELSATGHQIHRSTVYANPHTRPRANGYESKKKVMNNENVNTGRTTEEQAANTGQMEGRARPKRQHRKQHAATDT
ncbi:coiled-coil domain-containing protein 74A isoform X2 [Plutella xylostella]|uniref:coiled-coil domain-containing protein 74A isoform X2 n=1 Tax=Plutella xylostella TaxID=51655 RepID=UPI002032558C|nr:coiled-coil domain-containing protein 74A isoform X2 [Plutella xylostella]